MSDARMRAPASHADGADQSAPWHFALDELVATPWKNGCGLTREIAAWPVGAGLDAFDWRLSLAEVAASGPFSRFPGVDRHIALIDGPGMRLRADDGSFDVCLDEPGVPYAFAGELAVSASLLDRPTRDFNVMTRRGRCRAHVVVADESFTVEAGRHAVLVLPVQGTWIAETPAVTVRAGEGLLLPRGDGRVYRAARDGAGSRCLCVTMEMNS